MMGPNATAHFRLLERQREEIEEELGDLEWRVLPGKEQHIRLCRKNADPMQQTRRTGRTSSTLSFQKWAAAERMVKGDPGISSLKMSRELVVTQKTAWNLRKKIRGVEQICPPVQAMFGGPLILD